MTKFLFVSYSRREFYFTESLVLHLQNRKVPLWFDMQQLEPGVDWGLDIDNGLKHCSAVLLVVSQSALESRYVEKEWRHALDNRKPIYIALFEGVTIPKDLMRRAKIIDFRESFDQGIDHLMNAFWNKPIPKVTDTTMKKKPPFVTSLQHDLYLSMGGVSIILLLIIGLTIYISRLPLNVPLLALQALNIFYVFILLKYLVIYNTQLTRLQTRQYPFTAVADSFGRDKLKRFGLLSSIVFVLMSARKLFTYLTMTVWGFYGIANAREENKASLEINVGALSQTGLIIFAVAMLMSLTLIPLYLFVPLSRLLIKLLMLPMHGLRYVLDHTFDTVIKLEWRRLEASLYPSVTRKEFYENWHRLHPTLVQQAKNHKVENVTRIQLYYNLLYDKLKLGFDASDHYQPIKRRPSFLSSKNRTDDIANQVTYWYDACRKRTVTLKMMKDIYAYYNEIKSFYAFAFASRYINMLAANRALTLLESIIPLKPFLMPEIPDQRQLTYTLHYPKEDLVTAVNIKYLLYTPQLHQAEPNHQPHIHIILLSKHTDIVEHREMLSLFDKVENVVGILLDNRDFFKDVPNLGKRQVVDFRSRDASMLRTFFAYLHSNHVTYRAILSLNLSPVTLAAAEYSHRVNIQPVGGAATAFLTTVHRDDD